MVNEKQVPVGVKVISILYYIGAGFGVIFGLLFLFGAGVIGTLVADQIPLLSVLGPVFFIITGIIMLGFSVLSVFIGRGLWKARSWARIVAIVLIGLGLLSIIVSMVQGNIMGNLFGLVVSLVIGGYLIFSNKVKEAFA